MIDAELLDRYTQVYGNTFTVSLWLNRPGDTVNEMMRAALDRRGPVVTDARIAADLAARLKPPRS